MGHADGSVLALYSQCTDGMILDHVTDRMIRDLLDGPARTWEELAERRRLSARSPVAGLDRLPTGAEG
jgi:hypothetical protein